MTTATNKTSGTNEPPDETTKTVRLGFSYQNLFSANNDNY